MLIFCPTVLGQYVTLIFSSMALMDAGDILRLYSGTGTGGPLLQTFQGPLNTTSFCGAVVSQDVSGGCLTAQFFTSPAGVAAGWSAQLSCSPTPSITPSGTDCSSPVAIASVPYAATAHCTQCMLNDYQNQTGICNNTYSGEDRVYSYVTSASETDCITMSGTTGNPTLSIYEGCPGNGGVCLTTTPLVGNNTMLFVVFHLKSTTTICLFNCSFH